MEIEKVQKARVVVLQEGISKKGYTEIRLKDPKRTGTIVLRGYNGKDDNYRPYVNKNGSHRVLKISRTIYLNMENENDRLTYAQVLNHPIYLHPQTPVLSLVNHETESDQYVLKKDLEAQANAIVQQLKGEELTGFARVLLIKYKKGSSDNFIKRDIYEKCAENPEEVINEWNDEQRELKVLLREGIEKKVFEYKFGRYLFDDQLIGTTFEVAVDWLKDNEDLVPSLKKQMGYKTPNTKKVAA